MRKLILILGLLLYPLLASAAWFGTQFSADMMAYNPQWKQWQSMGKVYVGDARMRMEMGPANRRQVTIYDGKQDKLYMLNPERRAYMEHTVPPGGSMPMLAVQSMPGDRDSLCQQDKITCRKLGEDKVSGIPVEQWELVDQRDKLATLRTIEWLDTKRKMLLKKESPGNQSMELKFLGNAKQGGRSVEKWELTNRRGNQTSRTLSYVDPKLNAVIRLESGDHVMALSNIEEGPQPANLFQIPRDYRKVTPEEARRMGAGGQGMPQGMAPSLSPGMMPR
jgi:hypothetical protein